MFKSYLYFYKKAESCHGSLRRLFFNFKLRYSSINCRTASLAIISPAAEGTNAQLAGVARRLPVGASPSGNFSRGMEGLGTSSDHTTVSFLTPRFFNSFLITLARGQTDVL